MHLAAVAASMLALHSGVVSPGDPVTIRVAGPLPKAPLHAYLRDSVGMEHLLGTVPRGRRKIAVAFPQLPVDYYRLVGGRGTLAVRAAPPAGFGAPGVPGCSPASPVVGDETFGTAVGGAFWALDASPASVSTTQKKIIFKLTSVYPAVFYAVAPSGHRVDPVWRQSHSG